MRVRRVGRELENGGREGGLAPPNLEHGIVRAMDDGDDEGERMPKRGKREARVSRERGEGGTRELARSVRRSYSYWKLRHAPPKPQEGVVGCCSTHLPKLYHTPPLRVAPCACPGVCGMLVVVRSMSTHLSKTLLVQRGDTVGTEGTHSAATHVHCPTLRVGCAVGCHTRGLRQ